MVFCFANVNSISGGTVWHWRAWQRDAQWQATREAIHRYHQANGPQEGELLLLGCSAGWMLNTSWLKGFTKLTAVDLDPLAGWLFSLRHRGLKHLQWHQADALKQLDALLLAHPKASILFDNMLGQQTLIHLHEGRSSEKKLAVLEKDLAALKDRLRGRTWGSLHDRISGPVRISADRYKKYFEKPLVTESQNRQTNAQLMQTLGAFDEVNAYGEWLDHLTSRVFSRDAPRTYVLWPFAPSYWHWLELAWVKPGDNKISI